MRIRMPALFCAVAIPAAALAQAGPSPALVVHVKDFGYVPKDAKIDESAHTATAEHASFDSGYMAKDGTWSHTFTTAGTLPYNSIYHKFMRATVTLAEK